MKWVGAILGVCVAAVAAWLFLGPLFGPPATTPEEAGPVAPGSPAPADDAPSVLLITLDTTRADRLGCHGYAKAETPALDAAAAAGTRFTRAYANAPLTLPSHATILTGLLPPEHGLRVNGRNRLAADIPTLATLLSAGGYRTAAFLASFVLDKRFGLARGFQVYDDRMQPPPQADDLYAMENPADVVADRALAWLADHADARFFCWVHFFDPHVPYEPPEPYRTRLADPYDGEVAFMDRHVGRLLDFLKERGLRETTLVVIAGDHGEAFGEHDEFRHGELIYNTTMHVPLVLCLPGRIDAGRTVDGPVTLADIPRTVARVLGLDPPAAMGGRDLLAGPDPDRACYGESEFCLFEYGWAPLYSLTTARWKYIDCPDPELYDLASDFAERTNLFATEPRVAERLRERLSTRRDEMTARQAPSVKQDEAALRKLRELGYLSSTSGVRRDVDPGDRKDPKSMMDVVAACREAGDLTGKAAATGDKDIYRRVVRMLEPLARRSPESVNVHDYLAESYCALGLLDQGKRHLEAALAIHPSQRIFVQNLGSVLLRMEKTNEAVRVLKHGLRLPRGPLEPKTETGAPKPAVDMHVKLGMAYRRLGKRDAAARQFRIAIRLDPPNAEAHSKLGNLLSRGGEFEAAIPHYEAALKSDPKDAGVQSNLGVALARLGRLDDAIDAYRKSLELDSSNPDVHINLGDALLAAEQVEPALETYRAAVRVAAQETDRPAMVLGHALMRLGRHAAAREAFEAALKIRKSAGAYHNIGLIHGRAGRHEKAIEAYRKALDVDPKAVYARNNLGLTLCAMKRCREAIRTWKAGLALTPEHPLLTYNLAWWLATCPVGELRNADEAVRYAELTKAKTDGDDPRVLDALAAAYAEAGRFEKAVETAKQAADKARADDQAALAEAIGERLELYRASTPYRESP
ncbi:MAG: sulfatase-like hydrolase/transferase [Planctomycetota bacterium]